MTPIKQPDPSDLAVLGHLARTELSPRARLGHVLLALVASAMTIVVVSLWLTEVALPTRTQAAFGLLTAIGLGWVVFAAWVLSTKRVMLATHRLVAGRLAVVFSGAFAAGCALLASTTGAAAAAPAFVMSLVFLAVALVLWRRAAAGHSTLLARRDALERELARGAR